MNVDAISYAVNTTGMVLTIVFWGAILLIGLFFLIGTIFGRFK